MTGHDPINRNDLDSPELGLCDNCGRELREDDVVIDAHWHRYEGSDQSSGNGWVRWCVNCIPPGIPRQRQITPNKSPALDNEL